MTNNIVGQSFTKENETYRIIREIATNRENGDIYLCEDSTGKKYAAKYFCKRNPVSVVGYGLYNHFGRARDGSQHVINEIQSKAKLHPFIVNYYFRIKHNGHWLVLLDYVEGHPFGAFVKKNYLTDFNSVVKAVNALAETLAEWHNNFFAHGDPHLDNAMLQIQRDGSYKVILIDYGQIHHKDFEHCQNYYCLTGDPLKRMKEDLENESQLGRGFRNNIYDIQEELNLGNILVDVFNARYKELSALNII